MKYNAPTSHVIPSVKKRSSTLSQLPNDKSKAFDFLNEEWVTSGLTSHSDDLTLHHTFIQISVFSDLKYDPQEKNTAVAL